MFGRKKKEAKAAEVEALLQEQDAESTDAESSDATTAGKAKTKAGSDAEANTSSSGVAASTGAAGKSDRSRGPLDAAEVGDTPELVDLGSLRIPPLAGMNLNLEVEQESQAIVSVALELDGSRVQLQAFAAPKSDTLWPGISSQIDQSVTAQGGRTDRREGRFGEELLARVPGTGPDGSQGTMIARFVGVDGPRWFLRAVFGGPAAINEEAAKPLEELLGGVVVDRGQTPMAPTEMLPLHLPEGQAVPVPPTEDEEPAGLTDEAPKRGPEITQIG